MNNQSPFTTKNYQGIDPGFPKREAIEETGFGISAMGMSLRDYFAAKAMQTYMADQELIDMYCHLGKDVKQELATAAYMMADAMLKAREA